MTTSKPSLETLTDEDLVARINSGQEAEAESCREILFRRFYPKVAVWSLKWVSDREEARDLAQEVFLRIHQKLGTFRGGSRLSTWVYTVTRSVAINRGKARARRAAISVHSETAPEIQDPGRSADAVAETSQILARLRQSMARDLEPLEAKVLYLHHVHGMTLPAITELLDLQNRSGAKALVVSAKRKLNRKFGPWLRSQSGREDVLGDSG